MTWPLLGQKGLSSGAFAVSFREGTILSPKSESMIFWMLRRWFFCSLEGTPYRKKNTFWILNLKIQGLVSSHDFSLFSKAVQLQVTQAVRSFSRVFSTVGSFSFDQAKGSLPETFGELSRSLFLGRQEGDPLPQLWLGFYRIFGVLYQVISMDCWDYQTLSHQYHQTWSHFFLSKFLFGFGGWKNILTKQVEVE